MKFEFESEGGRLHWIVRCFDKGVVTEAHRFYRAPDGFIYHRGEHGPAELPAQAALTDYLSRHPELTDHVESMEPGENSTMDYRRRASGGGKRDKKEEPAKA